MCPGRPSFYDCIRTTKIITNLVARFDQRRGLEFGWTFFATWINLSFARSTQSLLVRKRVNTLTVSPKPSQCVEIKITGNWSPLGRSDAAGACLDRGDTSNRSGPWGRLLRPGRPIPTRFGGGAIDQIVTFSNVRIWGKSWSSKGH